jgi:hypothetical protein
MSIARPKDNITAFPQTQKTNIITGVGLLWLLNILAAIGI